MRGLRILEAEEILILSESLLKFLKMHLRFTFQRESKEDAMERE